jgi:uncharacterized protein YbbK (DUF523 family)
MGGLMRNNKKVIMISACLLGVKCRFDGTSREIPELLTALGDYELVSFCPEMSEELTIPRPPAEIQGSDGTGVLNGTARVINKNGYDCTPEFMRGAAAVLKMVKRIQPQFVVLKAKSPSCGVGKIYDGSFSGKLKDGDGVTTALLRGAGIIVYSETDILAAGFGKK